MTYPRNAASPEPIAIGAVVQISDGAVQTSGCTIRIKPIGVAEGDGGGTTAYSTDGVILYTPTQAETNYTSFVLIAKKTGCIPVAVTVVTSASATTGYVGTDQGKIANATSTVNLSGTTVKAVTDAVTAGTVSDKTGYSLSVAGVAAIWDALTSGMTTVGSIGKRIVDYLTGDIYARLGAPAGASVSADIADLPTVAEFEARTLAAASYATAANLAIVAGYIDTEIGTIITNLATIEGKIDTVDTVVDAILVDTGTTLQADITAILADTNELQTDWADGGRLDLILDARASQTSVDTIDDLLDTEVAAIKADTAAILQDTGTDGVVVAAGSKTGYSLASTGLDSIAVTAPSGVATTFPGMVVQLWRRFFKRATKTSTQIKTYADDGTTVVTTQTVSDDGTTETQGAAS